MTLKTHRPSGAASTPLILLEGEEKAGKTYACAEFSGCDRIGQTYWLELGPEGCAEEYGAVPGADYEVLEHEGAWWSILQVAEGVHAEAGRAAAAGEKPVMLVVDTMSAEWDLHKDWAYGRARNSTANQDKLAENPDAEIDISTNYWNDANSRHRRLMRLLLTFPGIAIVTARGKETVAMKNGKPVSGKKEYTLEAQKHLGFDSKVWVRMFRDRPPLIVGCRSVHSGIKPGVDKPLTVPDFSLEWLVFDYLKFDSASARPRDLHELVAMDAEAIEEWKRSTVIRIGECATTAELGELWKDAAARNKGGALPDEDAKAIGQILAARADQIKEAAAQATVQSITKDEAA